MDILICKLFTEFWSKCDTGSCSLMGTLDIDHPDISGPSKVPWWSDVNGGPICDGCQEVAFPLSSEQLTASYSFTAGETS